MNFSPPGPIVTKVGTSTNLRLHLKTKTMALDDKLLLSRAVSKKASAMVQGEQKRISEGDEYSPKGKNYRQSSINSITKAGDYNFNEKGFDEDISLTESEDDGAENGKFIDITQSAVQSVRQANSNGPRNDASFKIIDKTEKSHTAELLLNNSSIADPAFAMSPAALNETNSTLQNSNNNLQNK